MNDPMNGCCEYEADGERCHFPGVFNATTTGGGRWYCAEHDRCKDHQTGADIVTASLRAHPYPDFTLAARKQASERRAAGEVPHALYGKSEAEYRSMAKDELEKLARGNAVKPAPNPRQSSNQPAKVRA
jgi:hypothetical protein